MSRIPDADTATVAAGKIVDYLLNEAHPANKGRALLCGRFGFQSGAWKGLRDALLSHARDNTVVETEVTSYGVVYRVRCAIPSPDGRNPCTYSVWIVEPDCEPRFVTAFPGPQ